MILLPNKLSAKGASLVKSKQRQNHTGQDWHEYWGVIETTPEPDPIFGFYQDFKLLDELIKGVATWLALIKGHNVNQLFYQDLIIEITGLLNYLRGVSLSVFHEDKDTLLLIRMGNAIILANLSKVADLYGVEICVGIGELASAALIAVRNESSETPINIVHRTIAH